MKRKCFFFFIKLSFYVKLFLTKIGISNILFMIFIANDFTYMMNYGFNS